MTVAKPRSGRPRRERGQALAELALIIPIFFLVVLVLAEAGAFAWTLTVVEHAAQEGGRFAALPGTPDETAVKDRVIARSQPSLATVAPADITISITRCYTPPCTFSTRNSGQGVRLAIAYTYQPLLAVVFGGGATFNMSAVTEYTVE